MAVIVTILFSYAVKVGRRDALSKLWTGVGIALVVPLGAGALLTWGSYGLSFQAQEIIGGTLSLIAAGFVTGMIFWMSRAARTMRPALEHRLDSALVGSGWGMAALAAISVGREGIETALFVWATVASVGSGWEPFAGALLGLIAAAVLGFLICRKLVRIKLGMFFAWSGALLIAIAGGVLAYGIGDLQEAGVVPGAGIHAYDISALIPTSSWYGAVLAGILSFTPSPTWLQVAAWAGCITIAGCFCLRQHRFFRRSRADDRPAPTQPTAAHRTAAAESTLEQKAQHSPCPELRSEPSPVPSPAPQPSCSP